MTEKKLKPVAKKATLSKAGTGKNSAAPGKTRSNKKAVTAPAKNSAAIKPASKKPAGKTAVASPVKAIAGTRAENSSAAGKKLPAKESPAIKTAPPKAKTATINKPAAGPTPEERHRMIEMAAYFIAERHGFQGHADEHWAAAEREIAARLGG